MLCHQPGDTACDLFGMAPGVAPLATGAYADATLVSDEARSVLVDVLVEPGAAVAHPQRRFRPADGIEALGDRLLGDLREAPCCVALALAGVRQIAFGRFEWRVVRVTGIVLCTNKSRSSGAVISSITSP